MENTTLNEEKLSNKLMTYLRDERQNQEIAYQFPLTRLQGGYETSIFRFQLKGVEDGLSQPLVLRLYPAYYGTGNAKWESTIQNVLAGAGYPVAKVHFVCSDLSVLGGAFFIMDHIPGTPLMFADPNIVMSLMGKLHARIHSYDPAPLVRALQAAGYEPYQYGLQSGFDWLQDKGSKYPWASETVNWLLENRPPEPDRLSACHGDFHPLNIMFADGAVTGILDWPGLRIADPVFDVANTIVLTTVPAKHISASMEEFASIDWDLAVELYLTEYQKHRELDRTNLDYYRVRRCLQALIQGLEGQELWQQPMIVGDLVDYIHKITGIKVERNSP